MSSYLNGRGATVWLTGLPCSGKSTLGSMLASWMRERGYPRELLDGDEVRLNLSKGLGFSREDRDINVRRIGFVSRLLCRNGVMAIAAMVSPYRSTRQEIRQSIGNDFIEIFVDCPIHVCSQRDVKGMYKQAHAGLLKGFTGVDDPYEPPESPELIIKSSEEQPEVSLRNILEVLAVRGYIRSDL